MKKIYKFVLLALVFGSFTFQSCETTELELTNNPNNLTTGDPQFLLNYVQTRYRSAQSILSDRAAELTRIDNFFGENYLENLPDNTLNTPWRILYSDIIPDIEAIEAAATEENPLSHHLGMAKIMQAHLSMQLVDFLGDIINPDQAGNPTEFPSPELTNDGGLTNYNHSIALLDEAIALLNAGGSTANVQDLFYGNPDTGADSDASQWIRLANTLKMRAALTTGDMTTFNNIVSSGNFISSTEDDFEFRFGTQQTPINTMHPDYQTDYTPSGSAIYHSNWLMNQMLTNNDPRRRYYFYRQNDCTPGASCNTEGNSEKLSCSIQSVPAHIVGTPTEAFWCAVEDGYWGRLHRDAAGSPPDEFDKTAAGVYPAAGLFDDNAFGTSPRNLTLGAGGNGAGIEPIILASYVDFWRAEVALDQGDAVGAATYMGDGLAKSIDKVSGFIGLDSSADTSFEPSNDDINSYITAMTDALTSAGDTPDGWNILSEQYFVTLFGGGTDSYNFYRRTGYPTTVGQGVNDNANAGNFPRTFLYPGDEVSANPNVAQRTNLDTPTFWNTQPLPIAN